MLCKPIDDSYEKNAQNVANARALSILFIIRSMYDSNGSYSPLFITAFSSFIWSVFSITNFFARQWHTKTTPVVSSFSRLTQNVWLLEGKKTRCEFFFFFALYGSLNIQSLKITTISYTHWERSRMAWTKQWVGIKNKQLSTCHCNIVCTKFSDQVSSLFLHLPHCKSSNFSSDRWCCRKHR